MLVVTLRKIKTNNKERNINLIFLPREKPFYKLFVIGQNKKTILLEKALSKFVH
jgi:hypothetical protein